MSMSAAYFTYNRLLVFLELDEISTLDCIASWTITNADGIDGKRGSVPSSEREDKVFEYGLSAAWTAYVLLLLYDRRAYRAVKGIVSGCESTS
jgi:hypothetical protein